MSIPGSASPLFFGAGAAEAAAFQIDRSLRFNPGDSAYLSRTPSSAGNRRTWSWSGWVKRSSMATSVFALFAAYDSSGTRDVLRFESNKLNLQIGTSGTYRTETTDAVFRDPSAWYHIVAAFDSTQSTAADRLKLYVNGVEQSVTGTPVDQNTQSTISNTDIHYVGARSSSGSAELFFDGYMAEVHFVDGQALAASDFGEYDDNNVWQPKDTSGLTFGTNGFRLKFDDNSSAAALGNDSSGNDNDWTVNNLAVTGFEWPSTTWSDDISIDSGNYYLNNNDGPNGFDGNSSTYIDCRLGSGANNTTNIIWAPTGGISGVTKIRVHSEYASHYRINEGTWTTFNSQGTYVQIYSGSAFTLTKLEVRRDDNGGTDYGHRVTAYELNDVEVRDDQAQSSGQEGIDSLIDTPTNYSVDSGNAGGNYNTLNPLDNESHTLSNGNLDITNFGSTRQTHSTILPSSGKWYAEFTCNAAMNDVQIGVANNAGTSHLGADSNSWGVISINGNRIHGGGNNQSSYGSSYTTGDLIMVALDLDNGKWYAGKNGTWFNSGDPANGTNPAHSGLSGNIGFAVGSNNTGGDISCNFGARNFSYTPPTGFLSLCTQNLPDPTIADGSTAFDVGLYTGTGSATALAVSGPENPDFVWIKGRSGASSHALYDVIRGFNLRLYSNTTGSEYDYGSDILAPTSTGFNLTTSDVDHNSSSATYVAWQWVAGSSTVSNTDGSITSQVRANQTTGFSIMTLTFPSYSGTSSVGHGLNAAPHWWMMKDRDSADGWYVGHISLGAGKYLRLESTNAETSSTTLWDNTLPSSSVIYNNGTSMTGAGDYLMLAWAPVEGYSAFGSYTGNGSSDGPFVYTGFRPAWVMVKLSSETGENWLIKDSARDVDNPATENLYANLSIAESTTSARYIDFLSNGFKLRGDGTGVNGSGKTYIYAAFAEHPMSLNGGLAR